MNADVTGIHAVERKGVVAQRALAQPFPTDSPQGGFQLLPPKSRHQFGNFRVDCVLNEEGHTQLAEAQMWLRGKAESLINKTSR